MAEQVETSVPIDKYNRVVGLLRACNAHCKELESQLDAKERQLEEMGERLREAQFAQTDALWRSRLEKVSFKKCPTPQKQLLEVLVGTHRAAPHTEQGDFQVHMKVLSEATGMAVRTVRDHLDKMEAKGLIKRRYEGNGKEGSEHRDSLFIGVDERIIFNPTIIDRIVPVERGENRGGLRQKQERKCPACGSTDTQAHESGYCFACNEPWLIDLTQNSERQPAPEIEIVSTPAPAPVDPRPQTPCFCGKSTGWFWDEAEKEWICYPCLSPYSWTERQAQEHKQVLESWTA